MIKDQLIQCLRNNETPHDDFAMNVNFGHLVLNAQDLTAVAYKGEKGIEGLLQELARRDWEGIYDGETIVGVKKGQVVVNLQPGNQLEVKMENERSLQQIDKAYLDFLSAIFPLLEDRKQVLLSAGYQPVTKAAEIEMNPRAKNDYIAQFLGESDRALQLFKGAANTFVTIDYAHQDDFDKKFRVAYTLAPVFAALFDNMPYLEGQEPEVLTAKRLLWKECEQATSRLASPLAKRGYRYEDYVKFVLGAPTVMAQKDGELVYTGEKTLEEVYGEEISVEAAQAAMASVNPTIKADKGIQLRMIDALPYPLNMACVALIKGLFYTPDHLAALYELTMTLNNIDLARVYEEIMEKGMEAKFGTGTIRDTAKDLYFMVGPVLHPSEQHYIQPLETIIFKEVSPKDVTKKQLNSIKG